MIQGFASHALRLPACIKTSLFSKKKCKSVVVALFQEKLLDFSGNIVHYKYKMAILVLNLQVSG